MALSRPRYILASALLTLFGWLAAPSTLSSGLGATVTAGQIQSDVPYGLATGVTLLMDVYVPPGTGPFPALVAVHGGGFFQGSRSLMQGVSKYFAENGYVVFNIDYRLAPEFPYPAAVNDAKTAVRFVRDHAVDYHVDPTRIGIIGGSAGAAIAASVAAASNGNFDSGSGVAAAASWSAPFDLWKVFDERRHDPDVLTGIPGYIGMPGGDMDSAEARAKLKEASPHYQIERGDPPMFIANGVVEFIPFDQAQAFVRKLEKLDIAHEFLTPATGHALKYAGQAEPPTLKFFDRYVRDFKSPRATVSPGVVTVVPDPEGPSTGVEKPMLVGLIAAGGSLVLAMILWPVLRSRLRNRSWRSAR